MYALIELAKVRSIRAGRFYETMPDGRAIVPISELRAFGTLENVDIVATATELKRLIEKQREQGTPSTPDLPAEGDGTVTDGTAADSTTETIEGTAQDSTEIPPVKEEEVPMAQDEKPEVELLTKKKGGR